MADVGTRPVAMHEVARPALAAEGAGVSISFEDHELVTTAAAAAATTTAVAAPVRCAIGKTVGAAIN